MGFRAALCSGARLHRVARDRGAADLRDRARLSGRARQHLRPRSARGCFRRARLAVHRARLGADTRRWCYADRRTHAARVW